MTLQQVKVVIVGEAGCGKSNVLIRYTRDMFSNNIISTVGTEYEQKSIQVNDTQVKLDIWDTEGQERFRTITCSHYRDVDCVFIVYDISNKSSFLKVPSWIDSVTKNSPESAQIMILGNKSDLQNREVAPEEGEELASEYDLPFMEVSAKENVNIAEAFEKLVHRWISVHAPEVLTDTKEMRLVAHRSKTFPIFKRPKLDHLRRFVGKSFHITNISVHKEH